MDQRNLAFEWGTAYAGSMLGPTTSVAPTGETTHLSFDPAERTGLSELISSLAGAATSSVSATASTLALAPATTLPPHVFTSTSISSVEQSDGRNPRDEDAMGCVIYSPPKDQKTVLAPCHRACQSIGSGNESVACIGSWPVGSAIPWLEDENGGKYGGAHTAALCILKKLHG